MNHTQARTNVAPGGSGDPYLQAMADAPRKLRLKIAEHAARTGVSLAEAKRQIIGKANKPKAHPDDGSDAEPDVDVDDDEKKKRKKDRLTA